MKVAPDLHCALTACLAVSLLFLSTTALPQAAPAKPPGPAAANKGAPAKTTHLLHLSAVRLEGSGWTDERALGVVRSAARVLAGCGVKIERVELVSLDLPPAYLDRASPVSPELASDYPVARPAVYFVRGAPGSPTFQAEGFGRASSKSWRVLADTVWITSAASDAGILLARELAHVLMDSGEKSEEPGNLLRGENPAQNTALTPAQCARLRDTATGNGLLKKATARK